MQTRLNCLLLGKSAPFNYDDLVKSPVSHEATESTKRILNIFNVSFFVPLWRPVKMLVLTTASTIADIRQGGDRRRAWIWKQVFQAIRIRRRAGYVDRDT